MTAQNYTPFSLYIHIPFCASICGYCDFNTYTAHELGGGVSQGTFHELLIRELELASRTLDAPAVSTVFIGGGTPTLIGSEALTQILRGIEKYFPLNPDVEITTEANPDSVDAQMLSELRQGGFNRISFGMQSAARSVLATLQRTHTAGASEQAARWAREAGFEHVNFDLIYGTPGERDSDVRDSVNACISAGVDHVAAYSLIVEPGTAMARAVNSGALPPPDDDACADRHNIIDTMLQEAGFDWYEVANWAKPGGKSTHNQVYWTNANWWGVGPGAHSHVNGRRWMNHKHPATYAKALESGDALHWETEELTPEQIHVEKVMLALRTKVGLPVGELNAEELIRAQGFVRQGVIDPVQFGNGVVRVTDSQRLFADRVIRELLG
jgi:putative oxygen-independent coproporphyrinogen III oxidase